MKNTIQYNLLPEFAINRKELLGKGATGEVYAGIRSYMQAKHSPIKHQSQSKSSTSKPLTMKSPNTY